MKAVVCTSGGAEVVETADPEPARDEVIVEVDACGLCGSDVHALERGTTFEGQVLGHEFGGRIVEVGAGVDRPVKVGQTVAVNPLGSCGRCRACAKGLPFRCPERPNLGITAPGGYAQYVAVPATQLVALPSGLPTEFGAHAEPLAVSLNAVRRAMAGPGDSVLVYGVGPIGLNAIMALRLSGVDHIVAAGRSPGRRAAAAKVGADEVIDTREVSIGDHVRDSGRPFAAVLECSGAPGAIAESLGVLEPGGTCVEVALSAEVTGVPMSRMVAEGLRVSGSCAFSNDVYDEAVEHIAAGRVPVAELISERVDLETTPDALVRLRTPGELVRVLAKP
ncbi:zinc-dependent alcohol dehydrogenase [Amycolatopsis taiwanensis]|uniref:zinc-dependent alcohol dehydrogenase n=1 Tax=Amycolatopsis taiwanensis TaxID=342230 RepID=UPI002554584E|nr:alcohol dehydrogenase catalytic domain-containing protein [Amycolatopsis taiwanensis]